MISLENAWRSLDWCHIPQLSDSDHQATQSRWNFCCKAAFDDVHFFIVFFPWQSVLMAKEARLENWQLSWNGCFVVTQHCEEKNNKYISGVYPKTPLVTSCHHLSQL